MSNLIATKRVDLLAPYLALDQGSRVQAECEYSLPSYHPHLRILHLVLPISIRLDTYTYSRHRPILTLSRELR